MFISGDPALVKVLNGWHQNFMWPLLIVAGLHVVAAWRVTNADRVLEKVVRRYLNELPKVTHYVAAEAATDDSSFNATRQSAKVPVKRR